LSITKQPAITRAFLCLLDCTLLHKTFNITLLAGLPAITNYFGAIKMDTRLLRELQKHQPTRPLIERHNIERQPVPAYIEALTLALCGLVIIAGITWGAL
jgi:hypothetical protein